MSLVVLKMRTVMFLTFSNRCLREDKFTMRSVMFLTCSTRCCRENELGRSHNVHSNVSYVFHKVSQGG